MRAFRAGDPAEIPSGLGLASQQIAVGEKICRVGRSRLESVQAASEEQCISDEHIVDIIIDQLPELSCDVRRRRGHTGDVDRDRDGESMVMAMAMTMAMMIMLILMMKGRGDDAVVDADAMMRGL